jgi:hypothetical protein
MSESESESDNNYFSNTDSEKDQEETLEQLYPENDEELYEINQIINDHLKDIDIDDSLYNCETIAIKKRKKVRKRKVKENTKNIIQFTVNEFTVEKKKNKKWKSKRMQDNKKKKGHISKNVIVRKFHPNLPSPLYLRLNNLNNSKNININDKSFPDLKH